MLGTYINSKISPFLSPTGLEIEDPKMCSTKGNFSVCGAGSAYA